MSHHTAKRPLVGGLLAIAGLAMLLAIPALALAQTSQQVNISLKEFMINPPKITVTQGQSVQFTVTNNGTEEHNFTVESKQGDEEKLFDMNLKPSETRTAEYTFPTAGDWEMYCPLEDHKDHGMKGDLEVLSSAPGGMPSTGGQSYLSLLLVAFFGAGLLGGGLIVRKQSR